MNKHHIFLPCPYRYASALVQACSLNQNISVQSTRLNQRRGMTINNLNKFVVRHFEDQTLSGLKPNSDKTVTNPSLKAGVSGYTSYRGLSPDGTVT